MWSLSNSMQWLQHNHTHFETYHRMVVSGKKHTKHTKNIHKHTKSCQKRIHTYFIPCSWTDINDPFWRVDCTYALLTTVQSPRTNDHHSLRHKKFRWWDNWIPIMLRTPLLKSRNMICNGLGLADAVRPDQPKNLWNYVWFRASAANLPANVWSLNDDVRDLRHIT